MSQQISFLCGLIKTAQEGDAGAIKMLRDICKKAVEEAPAPDLILLGFCLVEIGETATKTECSRN